MIFFSGCSALTFLCHVIFLPLSFSISICHGLILQITCSLINMEFLLLYPALLVILGRFLRREGDRKSSALSLRESKVFPGNLQLGSPVLLFVMYPLCSKFTQDLRFSVQKPRIDSLSSVFGYVIPQDIWHGMSAQICG